MKFFIDLFKSTNNRKAIKVDKHHMVNCLSVIRDIDMNLAESIKDRVYIAYADSSFGFGVSECGNVLVLIYTVDCVKGRLQKKDEFIVDVDFDLDRKSLLKNLQS